MLWQLYVSVAITLLGFSLAALARYLGKNHGNGKTPDSKKP